MNYLDGFAGCGGFHLGLKLAGFQFEKVFYSEIDKHAIANYQYNFPNSIYAGSITAISKRTITDHIDLFTFGWPCQNNSIIGKREGHADGTQSNLFYKAIEIIREFKPFVFIAENVEGLRTVNKGIDIINALKTLAIFNNDMPQYDIEMQLVNTCEWLPQNRKRLYFIGHRRDAGARKILPIIIQNFKNDKKGGDTGSGIARTLLTRTDGRKTTVEGTIIGEMGIDGSIKYRDLIPIEYERLQGYPDDYTKYGIYNGITKEIIDTQWYKILGNSVSIPIVAEIGKQLLKIYNI